MIGEPFQNRGDKYVLTTGSVKFHDNINCGGGGGGGGGEGGGGGGGVVIHLTEEMIAVAYYFHRKATSEFLEFAHKRRYRK